MSNLYFYTAVGAFTVGIFLGSFYATSSSLILWLLGTALVCGVGAGRTRLQAASRGLLICSVILCAVSVALVRWSFVEPVTTPQLSALVGQEVELRGTVVREPDQRESSTHLYLATNDTIVLIYADRYSDVSYGDTLRVTGELRIPEAFTTDLGRTFDYRGFLEAKNVGYVMSFAAIEIVTSDPRYSPLSYLYAAKHSFMDNVEAAIPEPQVGLAQGLLLGVKQALGDEYEEIFRATGLTHIVVLSGYNVMLVVTFFMYALAFVLPYRARLIVGIVAIASFALLVGLSATVVRASVMASLLLLLRFTGNTYHLLRALCLAGVVMLVINPHLLLYDVGFQLSFVATLGLIVAAPFIQKYLSFMPEVVGMREFLAATLVTQVFVLPLLVYQIGEVSIIAVVANVVVLPMVPVAMLLTFAVGLVGYVSTTASVLLGYLAYLSLSYIITIASWLSSVPMATVTVPAFSPLGLFLCYVVLAVVIYKVFIQQDRSTSSNSTDKTDSGMTDELVGWVIEEELEARSASSSSSSTPNFFR